MKRTARIFLAVITISIVLSPVVLSQDYNGSTNVKRFLGRWNIYRDGWQHSMEISWNCVGFYQATETGDVGEFPPLTVKYYGQQNCQGVVLWEGYGFIHRDVAHKSSKNISILHPAPSPESADFCLFEGWLYSKGQANLAGIVIDKWGRWGWMAVRVSGTD